MLRPPDEKILTRALALVVAVALAATACVGQLPPQSAPGVLTPPNPPRNTAAVNDPADRARFQCAVAVQEGQSFEAGASLAHGSEIGAAVGGVTGGSLGALFGLIGDVPGPAAAVGATLLGAIGIVAGGLIKLDLDTRAYQRGLDACLAARTANPPPAEPAPPALVEYRLRVLSVRDRAFTSFLTSAELRDGATSAGLTALASSADTGALERGAILVDRHIGALAAAGAQAFGATPIVAPVKFGGVGRDYWDEARWYGKPGERSVWLVRSARNRRPQEVRRVALSDPAALAQYRPLTQPIFGVKPEATVAVSLSYLLHAQDRGALASWIDGALDRGRGIAAVVAVSDDEVFPDRVYLIVNHAASAATYEAILAWSFRGDDRELPRER